MYLKPISNIAIILVTIRLQAVTLISSSKAKRDKWNNCEGAKKRLSDPSVAKW